VAAARHDKIVFDAKNMSKTLPKDAVAKNPKSTHAKTADWSNFRINKNLTSPLYHQIFSFFRDRILTGAFDSGAVFPSESQIEFALKVSRITARRALEELAARGLIIRTQGKHSIVALYRPSTRLVAGVEGMIENNRRMGDSTTVELLAHEQIPASAEVAAKLKVKHKAAVLWTVRVRRLNDVPFSYAVTHLPAFVSRQVHAEQMSTRPLIDLLESAGILIARAEQVISAVQATPEVARALHVEPGTALLLSERIVYDRFERPVELICVQYRPDCYQYGVELKRTTSARGNRWASEKKTSAKTTVKEKK
jgi:GntR family transcriptional regulator